MTYRLGALSYAHLHGVHPRLVAVVDDAIRLSAQDFTVQEGLRSVAAERQHVADGTSKTMNSKHLVQPDGWGHAVDLVPWVDGEPQWIWGEPADLVGGCYAIALAMQRAAASLGVPVRWGGVWDRKLSDLGGSAVAMRQAHHDYVARFEAANHRPPLCDGPHFELA